MFTNHMNIWGMFSLFMSHVLDLVTKQKGETMNGTLFLCLLEVIIAVTLNADFG